MRQKELFPLNNMADEAYDSQIMMCGCISRYSFVVSAGNRMYLVKNDRVGLQMSKFA